MELTRCSKLDSWFPSKVMKSKRGMLIVGEAAPKWCGRGPPQLGRLRKEVWKKYGKDKQWRPLLCELMVFMNSLHGPA